MAATSAQIRQVLRLLADWPPADLPVISAYLDLRPQSGGDNPQVRSGEVVLRDQLREAERSLEPRTPAHESFVADVEHINHFIAEEALPEVQGLALFACHGAGRFQTIDTSLDLDDEVTVGPLPQLLRLARLADQPQAVIALVDTNTLRLFASRSGAIEEVGLLDDDPDEYSKHSQGGWSQARFQRHVDEQRAGFAELAVDALEGEVRRQEADTVVLAGDEVAIPLTRDKLPHHIAEMVRGVVRIDMRATLQDVEAEVLPFLEVVRTDAVNETADRLVGAVRGDGMGVAGLDGTRRALEQGQVMELLMDQDADLGSEAEALVRAAIATDARVRFTQDHSGLRKLGGVGGLLRFRLDASA